MRLDESRLKCLDDAISSLESELLKNFAIAESSLSENPVFLEKAI